MARNILFEVVANAISYLKICVDFFFKGFNNETVMKVIYLIIIILFGFSLLECSKKEESKEATKKVNKIHIKKTSKKLTKKEKKKKEKKKPSKNKKENKNKRKKKETKSSKINQKHKGKLTKNEPKGKKSPTVNKTTHHIVEKAKNTPAPSHSHSVKKTAKKNHTQSSAIKYIVAEKGIDISGIINKKMIYSILGTKKLRKTETLNGVIPDYNYNSVRFYDPSNKTLGVAVQYWKFKTIIEARRKFSNLKQSFPTIQESDIITPRTFLSYYQGILSISFLDLKAKVLVTISCSDDVCNLNKLVKLAKEINKKITKNG